MAGKGFNRKITETSRDDEREFKGSGVEGKKGQPAPSNKKNKDKEDLKDDRN